MDGSRERMREIFDQARRLAKPERAAFLNGLAAPGEPMREQIEDMLAAHDEAGAFLSEPTRDAASDAAETTAAPLREGPGTRVGPYKLLQLIGEGGFGSVFMAEQEKPVSRKVALKIIKLGMDTRAVIARFEAERQALAIMDHPNIAKVLDAGATETGRPYFVMELCKGEAIVEYCDKQNLSIDDRLDLFAQVCQAVQHAHTKGIIHRDIKPSNILVSVQDGRPHPKVIDFGIAKATASKLTEKTLFTEHRQLIGTPEYMSPEQAEGSLDIDTRTDVYALGVLLYELLTGTTPFSGKELRSAAYAEIQRIIREVEPPKPSTRLSANTDTLASVAAQRHTEPRKLGTIVRGDLDWIVMKALEKDRQRRYETANGLAMDIQRFLAGEPVLAAPPSAVYRMRKFVRRHKGPVAAGLLVAMVLTFGVIGTSIGMVQASRERQRVMGQRNTAARALSAVARELEQRVRDNPMHLEGLNPQVGQSPNAQAALGLQGVTVPEWSGEEVEGLAAAATELMGKLDAARAAERARADQLKQVSDFQETMLAQVNPTTAGARLTEDVNRRFAAALEREKVPEAERAGLADAFRRDWARVNATDAAAALIDETILRPAAKAIDGKFKGQPVVDAQLRQTLARVYIDLGLYDAAMPLQTRALEVRRRVLGEEHRDTLPSISNMGTLLRLRGKRDDAEALFREVLEKERRVLGEEDPHTVTALNNLATVLFDQRRFAEAEPYFREALERGRRVLGEQHVETLNFINDMGSVLQSQGRLADAEPYFLEAVDKGRRVLGEQHRMTLVYLNNLGTLLDQLGKLPKAEACLREALEKRRLVLGEEHPETISSISNLGSVLRAEGKPKEAEALFREALEKYRRVLGSDHPSTVLVMGKLGNILQGQGKLAEAERLYREVLKRSRPLGLEKPTTLELMSNLSMVLSVQGRIVEAEAVLAEGLGVCERAFTSPQPATALLLHHHADMLRALGRLEDAEGEARRAVDMYRSHPEWSPPEAAHADSILGLIRVAILKGQGKVDEALAAQRQVVSALRQTVGPDSAELGGFLSAFGLDLLTRGTLEAAKEAEPVLRESLEIRVKAIPNDWRVPNTHSLLGGAILAMADLDPALTPEARAARLREAEPLLLEGYTGMRDHRSMPTPARNGGFDRPREALERVVHLYEVWDKTEPGKGYDTKAAEWKAKLDAAPSTSNQK